MEHISKKWCPEVSKQAFMVLSPTYTKRAEKVLNFGCPERVYWNHDKHIELYTHSETQKPKIQHVFSHIEIIFWILKVNRARNSKKIKPCGVKFKWKWLMIYYINHVWLRHWSLFLIMDRNNKTIWKLKQCYFTL